MRLCSASSDECECDSDSCSGVVTVVATNVGDERERAPDAIDTPDRLGPIPPPDQPTAHTSKPQDEKGSEGEEAEGVQQQADETYQIHGELDGWAFTQVLIGLYSLAGVVQARFG